MKRKIRNLGCPCNACPMFVTFPELGHIVACQLDMRTKLYGTKTRLRERGWTFFTLPDERGMLPCLLMRVDVVPGSLNTVSRDGNCSFLPSILCRSMLNCVIVVVLVGGVGISPLLHCMDQLTMGRGGPVSARPSIRIPMPRTHKKGGHDVFALGRYAFQASLFNDVCCVCATYSLGRRANTNESWNRRNRRNRRRKVCLGHVCLSA